MPAYPGLLNIWEDARDVQRALLASLDTAVKTAEDEACSTTVNGVKQVANLVETHLPAGVERTRRVLMSEAMFSPKATAGERNSTSAVVAGGTYGLGLCPAQHNEILDVSFFDIFDVQHQTCLHFGGEKTSNIDSDSSAGALSVVSIGFGALSVAGGKALGPRGIVEGLVRVSDFFSNENTHNWIAPVIGVVALDLTVYFGTDLLQTVPRNINRRIKHNLTDASTPSGCGQFVEAHLVRVSKETRKVLRLASWDFRERFRVVMEERGREVKTAEELGQDALRAIEFFGEVTNRN
jgi:mitofusin